LGVALSTVSNFFNCKPVSIAKFEEICEVLDLERRVVALPIQSNPKVFVPILYDKETWVGRDTLIADLLGKLQRETRLLWITGISGIGKTILGECLASKTWTANQSFQWVYLEILGGQITDFASVATEWLSKLGDRNFSPQELNNADLLAKRLLQKLQAQPYWIQLDSLERLLKPNEPTEFADAYWVTFLRRCLTETNFASRLVLTAQALPNALVEFGDRYPNVWSEIRLDGLLNIDQQLEFFTKRGLFLETSNREILTRIAQIYEGHPLVLKVIAEDILKEFVGNADRYWQVNQREFEQVARELQDTRLDETEYNEALDRKVRDRIQKSLEQLPADALDLLCRSSVFRRPVPRRFWLAMIDDCSLSAQKVAYRVLGDRALLEREGTSIRQHNLIRSVAYELLKVDTGRWAYAERQAAHLWLTAYEPAADAANLEKVRGYLEAFDHYCEIQDWGEASEILKKNLALLNNQRFNQQLTTWGYYEKVIQMNQRVLSRVSSGIDVLSSRALGAAFFYLGNYAKAIEYWNQSLELSRKINDLWSEARILTNLAMAHDYKSDYLIAIQYHEQALEVNRMLNDLETQRNITGNLGITYTKLGNYMEAIKHSQQSLEASRELHDKHGEGNEFGNIGNIFYLLGEHGQSLEYYTKWLDIAHEVGDRWGKCEALKGFGKNYYKIHDYKQSKEYFDLALEIACEITDKLSEAEILKCLAELHYAIDEYETAQQYCRQALVLATELGIPLALECEALKLKLGKVSVNGREN
jgi:tetratricopeptide (TPR) repeat protein